MEAIINTIYELLWGPWMIYGILIVGLIFTVRTRGVQVRFLKDMFGQIFTGKKSDAGVSSFQAMTMALSGRIGTGNIAGTATAIAFGGPGAIFWMWAIAFIGSATAYVESTLAQIYKEEKNGVYRGGPAFYIHKFTGKRWLGMIFAIAALIAMSFLQPTVQANAIADAMYNAFELPKWVSGLVVCVILGAIIIGGVKRIATAASIIVPFMAIAYILVAAIIIAMNISEVPYIFALIFKSAFGAEQMFSGMVGAAIAWGVKRGIYANEAGQGTGPHSAAAAEVSHPVKQGLVQAASVYLDTFLVCTATAFMILFTGMYNVQEDDGKGTFIVEHLPGVEAGTAFTQHAVDAAFPIAGFGTIFVAFALFFFAFTTTMAYYYIAETNVAYLFDGKKQKIGVRVVQIVILLATYFGAVRPAAAAWVLGDIGLGIMVWVNVIAILFMAKPAVLALKDYEQQKRMGLDPVFDPRKVGIKNATFWEK
ncbi:alanine:cation symporter family protein [Kurthia gibsonii]|uniref:Alanine/glycine:cation symporter family protein n=1 Tax=Kurthia gibsonii TaxID=33946 RepID=A0ABU9LII4_9BACL|nr:MULTISPECIES: alanine/glycine:cation symporter family protein [Kurthia]MCA9725214.1 alanine:cation symporter family protein [Kurthia sp.]AMA63776.1 amino acid carrier family protein [Kurthia sp. 11kri321]MEB6112512.1 alanine:cation symporter family protein [Kurthia gibsonii]RXH51489.1 alanine:cation symporter family protein [Kurthia gibsonii]WIL37860.1 alanine/glycine:cation symporter family protein [Kurthia sp. YJT4]